MEQQVWRYRKAVNGLTSSALKPSAIPRRSFVTYRQNFGWKGVRTRIVLGPCHEFKDLLEKYGITRGMLTRTTTPEGKLRKYAKLGYEFQDKRKRDIKYIGPWTEQL